jgi:hypothetical protein
VTGRVRRAVVVLAAILATTSCSGSSDLDAHTQRQLAADVQQVQAAVARADRAGARAALRELTQTVTSLADAGRLEQDRATEILAAAREVADHLGLLPAPPSPSPSPTPTASAPIPAEEGGNSNAQGDGEGDGQGNGHAYGHDGHRGNGND